MIDLSDNQWKTLYFHKKFWTISVLTFDGWGLMVGVSDKDTRFVALGQHKPCGTHIETIRHKGEKRYYCKKCDLRASRQAQSGIDHAILAHWEHLPTI